MLNFSRSNYRTLAVILWAVLVPAAGPVLGTGLVQQEWFPSPPPDRTLIYYAGSGNTLVALPWEAGTTPLSVEKVAGKDKLSSIALKGEQAGASLSGAAPRFFLFVSDQPGVHPPFLVRLTPKRGERRVTIAAQRGQRGFAISSDEIVKPNYRVLTREGGMLFMEVTAREPLPPGEYAFIGTDLQRIASFRIVGASNHVVSRAARVSL